MPKRRPAGARLLVNRRGPSRSLAAGQRSAQALQISNFLRGVGERLFGADFTVEDAALRLAENVPRFGPTFAKDIGIDCRVDLGVHAEGNLAAVEVDRFVHDGPVSGFFENGEEVSGCPEDFLASLGKLGVLEEGKGFLFVLAGLEQAEFASRHR